MQSFIYFVNVADGGRGVRFIQHKMSLDLSRADLWQRRQGSHGEVVGVRARRRWVEAAKHLGQLPGGAVTHVLLKVHTTRPDQSRIQPVFRAGGMTRNDYYTLEILSYHQQYNHHHQFK